MLIEPDVKYCSKAKYNALSIKGKNSTVLKRWPELEMYPEFLVDYGTHKDVHLNTECILRFCLIFYQKNTINLVEPNFWKSKRIAAEWAGFEIDPKTGEFSDRLEQVLLGKNRVVNKLIARVLQVSEDILFQQYLTYESVRYRHMLLLQDGDERNSKNSLEVLDRVSESIKKVQEEMLKSDNNTPIKDELYSAVVIATMPTPEVIATAKRQDHMDQVIDKRYEKTYRKIEDGGLGKL
jgi:hypothetical protein